MIYQDTPATWNMHETGLEVMKWTLQKKKDGAPSSVADDWMPMDACLYTGRR